MAAQMATTRPRLWVPGDWSAFFGFGTNILVNMLVLTGLLRFVLKMPGELVFGRILPATGLMLCLSTMYYAWLAYRLARDTGRTDVCALPPGISVPHMFVVVFVIMLPILISTKDPVQAWEAGLTWVPQIAAWGKTQIDGALNAAGTTAAAVGMDKLGQTRVLYHGLEILGSGAVLGGIILGAITVFIIERDFTKAAASAGAVLTFFGFMHAEAIGIGRTPGVAVSYLVVAAILVACAKYAEVAPRPAEEEEMPAHGHGAPVAKPAE